MKIILVGASGRIGREIDKLLSANHSIVRVGVKSGDVQCDYTNKQSVNEMFTTIGAFDALISVAGRDSIFKNFEELEDDDYRYGFERKFLGQVGFVTLGQKFINDNGSFTFTGGFLSHYPHPTSAATGPLNAAIDSFVKTTAPLLSRGIRLNVVSPAPIVEPSQVKRGLVTAEQTAKLFVNAIEGNMSGQILRAWGGLPVPE
jgi:NAD(P)-dependent dehydrogenase (short-subunit alcohol dehydrogenase family)